MSRTTMKQLESAVEFLNIETNSPLTAYESVDGRLVPNAGHYSIDSAYGGYRLVRMCKGGGERDIQPQRGTKTDCWNAIHTVLNVLRAQ